MLLSGDLPQGSVCTTNAVSALIEELQYTLGEGPVHRRPPAARPGHRARPGRSGDRRGGRSSPVPLSTPALGRCSGSRSSIGDVHVGALNLYRDRPGPLTAEQHADARRHGRRGRPSHHRHAGRRRARGLGARPGDRAATSGSSSIRPPGWSPRSSSVPVDRSAVAACAPTPSAPAGPCRTSPPTSSPVGCASTDRRASEPSRAAARRDGSIYDRGGHGPSECPLTLEAVVTRESVLARTMVELADNLVDDFDIVDLLTMLVRPLRRGARRRRRRHHAGHPHRDLQLITASSEAMRVVELFELQTAEGPCLDCFHARQPVVNQDLTDRARPLAAVRRRWPSNKVSVPPTRSRCACGARSSAP